MSTRNTHISPTLTVDSVCFAVFNGELHVLLLTREREPFAGSWALPGGYVNQQETTLDAATRILLSKAGTALTTLSYYEQLYTFDTIGGDPRGHAVSVAYMGLATDMDLRPNARWHTVAHLPPLVFEHKQIIETAVKRLRSKLNYSNVAYALLPVEFTLTLLQSVYQSVASSELDKRNFRKKVLSTGLIEPTGKKTAGVSNRPAALYRFKEQAFREIEQFMLI